MNDSRIDGLNSIMSIKEIGCIDKTISTTTTTKPTPSV